MTCKRPQGQQTLMQFLTEDYAPNRLNLSAIAQEQIAVAIRRLNAHLGRDVLTCELSQDLLTKWLKALSEKGQAAATINGKRSAILSLWKVAAKLGKAPKMPDRSDIPTKRKPRRLPNSWTVAQMQAILESCKEELGVFKFSGIPRAHFLTSLILFQYETGTRLTAELRVHPDDLNFSTGTVYLRWESAKTGIEQIHFLSNEALSAIARHWDPQRKYIWPWGTNRNCLWAALRRVLKRAGLPSDRRSMFHRFRRTTATLLTGRLGLSAASAVLGHTNEETTRRSYVDPSNLPGTRPIDHLPRLGG